MRGAIVDEPHAERLAPEDDILGDCHVLDETELLGDHRDPGSERISRAGEMNGPPVDLDLPAIRLEKSHDDVEESRFARAIAAAQSVHGARTQRERAREKRGNSVERLADILSPQKEICHDLASQKLLCEHERNSRGQEGFIGEYQSPPVRDLPDNLIVARRARSRLAKCLPQSFKLRQLRGFDKLKC